MNRRSGGIVLLVSVLAFVFTFNNASNADSKRVLITQEIDQNRLITLVGNTHPEANAANDRGRVPDDFAMSHMMLLLRRPTELQESFVTYLDDLHNPASPNYYRWLTAVQVGEKYGLAQHDINTIESWLRSQGFAINTVYENGILIDFSGTAAQVSKAFHTDIHELEVHGEHHIANMSDPKIPDALAPAIVGVVSLNDFMPHPMVRTKQSGDGVGSGPSPDYTIGPCAANKHAAVPDCYLVVPADLDTIYNFPPHSPGQMGEGQTIVLIEDTDLYMSNTQGYKADWNAFRREFGLNTIPSSLNQTHPGPGCLDPGINAADGEAALDVEWATAAAPAANIVLASCKDVFIFGGFLALQNLLQLRPPPPIVSISYGYPETLLGATYNAYIDDLYVIAGAEGVSVYVAAGDSGADVNGYKFGINVSGYASTPDNVAVGGTDFEDSYLNSNGILYSKYWNSGNNQYHGSAKSYIPEVPWNESCAGELLASFEHKTPLDLCKSGAFLLIGGGSGGPSGCAMGTPSIPGVVSPGCVGYPKPYFQTGIPNIQNDGVRDLPDVSLFAAGAVWGHYYVFCFSDPNNGGVPCTQGAPNNWSGSGGTSFAAPIWAGIQALLNQKINSSSGNPDYTLYSLAGKDPNYKSGNCNSNSATGPNSACIFYDITPTNPTGGPALKTDNDQPCQADPNNGVLYDCYLPSGYTFGVLSTSNSLYQPAYPSAAGWDYATGIGTVNVQNLVNSWPPPPPPPITCWPYAC